MISEALKLSADPHSPCSMSGPPPPQRRGEARNLRLRSSSRARTPAPSHSCAGGSEQEAVCDVRRSRAAWRDRAPGNTAGTGKGKGCAGGSGQQKGYGAETGSKGYRRGKGKRAQEPLVGTGHQKFRVACINLGGWRKRIKYVYEWNMWNMPADLILLLRSRRGDVRADDAGSPEMGTSKQPRGRAGTAARLRRNILCTSLGGFASAQRLRHIWLGT